MKTPRDPRPGEGEDGGGRAVAFSVQIYGVLIRAYPEDLRGEYGDEMVRSFRDLYRREIRGRGAWGVVLLWARALPELVFTALKERSTMLARDTYLPARPAVVTRWGGLCALLGGVSGTVAYYLGTRVAPVSSVVLLLSVLLCALGLLGLYATLAASSGRPGRLAAIGAVLAVASAGACLALGAFWALALAWGWAAGPTHAAAAVALCCWFVGLLLLGVAALGTRLPGRLRVLPLTVIAMVPVSILLPSFVSVGMPIVTCLPFLGSALLGLTLLRDGGAVGSSDGLVVTSGAGSGGASISRPVAEATSRATRGAHTAEPAEETLKEKELLGAIRTRGALTVAGAALETSLSVDEADRMLSALAAKGHLEVRVERGRLLYSLWAGDE